MEFLRMVLILIAATLWIFIVTAGILSIHLEYKKTYVTWIAQVIGKTAENLSEKLKKEE